MAFLAVVARTSSKGLEYLVTEPGGREWVESAQLAHRYETLRDATREALRLPSSLKAFALPAED